MAKDKERSLNPAALQRKAEKQRALKKGKAAVAAQRNERLAQRNPDRLQTQIDELRSRQSENGSLPQRELALLESLERDVNRIRKAKTTLGQDQTSRPSGGARWRQDDDGQQVLGKRRRYEDSNARTPVSSDTDDDVRGIPMPRDTPPPVSHRRPDRRRHEDQEQATTLSQDRPVPSAKVVYESKPVIRDFRKEATGLVPSVVKRKLDAVRGKQQTLLEEDELEQLEREGYGAPVNHQSTRPPDSGDSSPSTTAVKTPNQGGKMHARVEDVDDDG